MIEAGDDLKMLEVKLQINNVIQFPLFTKVYTDERFINGHKPRAVTDRSYCLVDYLTALFQLQMLYSAYSVKKDSQYKLHSNYGPRFYYREPKL